MGREKIRNLKFIELKYDKNAIRAQGRSREGEVKKAERLTAEKVSLKKDFQKSEAESKSKSLRRPIPGKKSGRRKKPNDGIGGKRASGQMRKQGKIRKRGSG